MAHCRCSDPLDIRYVLLYMLFINTMFQAYHLYNKGDSKNLFYEVHEGVVIIK